VRGRIRSPHSSGGLQNSGGAAGLGAARRASCGARRPVGTDRRTDESRHRLMLRRLRQDIVSNASFVRKSNHLKNFNDSKTVSFDSSNEFLNRYCRAYSPINVAERSGRTCRPIARRPVLDA